MFEKSYSHLIGRVVPQGSSLLYYSLCGNVDISIEGRFDPNSFSVYKFDGIYTFTRKVEDVKCDECILVNFQNRADHANSV